MNHLKIYNRKDIDALVSHRDGETKLGETAACIADENWERALQLSAATFVVLGIPEDIGVKANYGIGGTQSVWQPALKAILNVQQTDKLQGNDLLFLGYFDFADWMKECEEKPVDALRAIVRQIDDEVYPVIEKIVKAGKIPIVIGGGHNNAYPIIKGVSLAKQMPVNSVNLDAHSDYRLMEGRHSGNGFRYAKHDGYLKKYLAFGLHENYNGANVLADMDADDDVRYFFFEDIFLHEEKDFNTAINETVTFLDKAPVGLELDLDCISNVLSSAATPCGISTLQARQFVTFITAQTNIAYLHLPEGAIRLDDGRESAFTPKLIAYLITDFIKAKKRVLTA